MTIREQIIQFYTRYCNNKLNKNCTQLGYYTRRGGPEILVFVQNYFDDHPILKSAPLAQKYWHIYHNTVDVPNTRFVNFQRGYLKGNQSKPPVSINESVNYFKQSLLDIPILNTLDLTQAQLNITSTPIPRFNNLKSAQKWCIKHQQLLSACLYHTQSLDWSQPYRIYSLKTNTATIHCICGKLKGFIRHGVLKGTCGNQVCVNEIRRRVGQTRDLTYFRTPELYQKRQQSKQKTYKHHSPETIEKIRQSNRIAWTPERKIRQVKINTDNGVYVKMSNTIKKKIANGEFTPKSTNRFTWKRLSSDITGVTTYRSSWELKFHETIPHLKFEILRIPYVFEGVNHTYIVDFFDDINNVAYEVKPLSLAETPRNIAKMKALQEWCLQNNATCKLITEKDLQL